MAEITLEINGRMRRVDVAAATPLLWVLRDPLGLTGTKCGCAIGLCGACTVHAEGEALRQTPVSSLGAKAITTFEGLSADRCDPLQRAWITAQVPQCGCRQSGQIMQDARFLAKTPHPTCEQIDVAMLGNICRCATYQGIRGAIQRAAGQNS